LHLKQVAEYTVNDTKRDLATLLSDFVAALPGAAIFFDRVSMLKDVAFNEGYYIDSTEVTVIAMSCWLIARVQG